MSFSFHRLWYGLAILGAILLTLLDEWIKFIALKTFPLFEGTVSNSSFLQLALHKNYGIAFNIPLYLPMVIILTVIISGILFILALKQWKTYPFISLACFVIICGAFGNAFDRVVYGFTVDYLILFGTSAINLSDFLIISGVIGLLFGTKYLSTSSSVHNYP